MGRYPELVQAERSADQQRARLAAALDQLERAELYVVAALDLVADDPDRRRALEGLRAELVSARRSLARPRVITH